MASTRKVALVHDWLVGMRGGEKVLELLCELFPNATLFTLVHRRGTVAPSIERLPIRTSFIQRLPFGRRYYRYFLPLYPSAARRLDVRDFDLVISSSHAAAKGVRPARDAIHVCYCHTPMRYIWDQYDQYFGPGRASLPVRAGMKLILGHLRRWDVATSGNVGHFIANSRTVQERIRRIYKRESTVIYPPVDVGRFPLSLADDGFYLIVSALVPYKRIDIAVEAFTILNKRLVVVGSGPEEKKLRSLAGTNVEFTGWAPEADLAGYLARCRALVFPAEEDFGIAPVEAMSCGKPVIAFAAGGALETVSDKKTGLFFDGQNSGSLMEAVRRFEEMSFDPRAIRNHAGGFARELCKSRLRSFLAEACGEDAVS
jgi:glycosyltransferase involved in cell wall biosynthesis